MANAQKYSKSASGHLAAHFERKKIPVKDKDGNVSMEYIKFGNQDIDPSRTHLNYNLAPERIGGQLAFIKQRTMEVKTLNRADVKVMVSWVITLPEYEHQNKDIHVSIDKEKIEKIFFERVYKYLCEKYGEENVISAYVHKDENKPHMHYAFVPVTEDRKHGGLKVSAKEVINRNELKSFHTDLERHLDSFGDWHFKVVNEATKDGNKTIAELKKQTAHEEVLKAQQDAAEARQRALNAEQEIKPLKEKKKSLESEIEALQSQKEILTAEEVKAIKAEKNFIGGLKGVTYKEFEAVKRTASAVESMTAERDQALVRAEKAELRATTAEAKVEEAFKDANRQLQAKIAEVEQDRPTLKMTQENIQLHRENDELRQENSNLKETVSRLERIANSLKAIIKEKLPDVYAAITQRTSPEQQNSQKERKKSAPEHRR